MYSRHQRLCWFICELKNKANNKLQKIRLLRNQNVNKAKLTRENEMKQNQKVYLCTVNFKKNQEK